MQTIQRLSLAVVIALLSAPDFLQRHVRDPALVALDHQESNPNVIANFGNAASRARKTSMTAPLPICVVEHAHTTTRLFNPVL